MLYQWLNYAVAVLANGRAVKRIPNTDPVLWEDMGVSDITMTRVCLKGLMIVFLTHTGRLLIGTETTELVSVLWDQQLICKDITEIDDMAIGNQTVVVRAGNCVGIINIDKKGTTMVSRRYGPSFELFGLCSEFVVVKTRDNKLGMLARRAQSGSPLVFMKPSTISVEYTRSIEEIVCMPNWLLLIMDNGSVYARGMQSGTGLSWPFKRRGPPDRNESVIKISHSGDYFIYITERGLCYHTSAKDYTRFWDIVGFVLPPGLDEIIIESAYMLANGKALVAVHDGGKASLLHAIPSIDITWGYRGYSSQRWGKDYRLVPLPLFDDESVTAITEVGNSIGITTVEGLVYWAQLDELINMPEPKLVRDQFFDTNPLAVLTGAQRIRSAGSVLNRPVSSQI